MTEPKRRLRHVERVRAAVDDAAKPERKPTTPHKTKRDASRWHELNQFIDCTMRELKPRQVAVWLTLFRDSRKGVATTSQTDIARRCGLRRPTVSGAIGELEALGLVTTLHQGGLNRGMSRYRIQSLIQRR